MKKILLLLVGVTLVVGTQSLLKAQTFVGSDACKVCHTAKYDDWFDSGHPYKFSVIENNEAPTYPGFVTNYLDTWLANLGDGSHTWADVGGVIGGFGWKSRFVGKDGYVMGTAGSAYSTGLGHNQFNFFDGENHGWVDYEASNENNLYNYGCFKCHTTGGTQDGTWLTGVDGLGNFTEGGVGCEGCHGPGSEHVTAGDITKIDRVYEFAHLDNADGGLTTYGVLQTPDPDGDDVNFLCGTCHNRSYTNPINSSGGFIKHHEQWDEFVSSTHGKNGFTCLTCHDPHKRVIWDGDGITKTCNTCHSTQNETTNHSASAGCIDCHMPYAAKSGTTRGQSGYVGDVRSHLLKINIDGETMFTDDSTAVRDDDTRTAALSLHYTCLGCHNNDPDDNIPDKTIEQAMAAAANMHKPNSIAQYTADVEMNIYPNPAFETANINFDLNSPEYVSIDIFNAAGQIIYSLGSEYRSAGSHTVTWDGSSNSGATNIYSGIYFVKVSVGSASTTKKLMIIK